MYAFYDYIKNTIQYNLESERKQTIITQDLESF